MLHRNSSIDSGQLRVILPCAVYQLGTVGLRQEAEGALGRQR